MSLGILKNSLFLRNLSFSVYKHNKCFARTLYTPELLGITDFKKERDMLKKRLGKKTDKFLKQLDVSMQEEKPLYSDDVKTLILLTTTKDEITYLETVLKRFHQQQRKAMYPSNFKDNALMLKMFYVNHEVDDAYRWIKTKLHNQGTFGIDSYVLIMDMLLEEGKYDKVLDIVDFYYAKFDKPSQAVTTLALAALYNKNCEECLVRVQRLLDHACQHDVALNGRNQFHATLLAYKQKQYGAMLELLNQPCFSKVNMGVNTRSINPRVLAYIEMDRVEEAASYMKSLLTHMAVAKPIVFPEVLEKLSVAVKVSDNFELKSSFVHIEQSLKRAGFVHSMSIEEFLSQPIDREHKLMKKLVYSDRQMMGQRTDHLLT